MQRNYLLTLPTILLISLASLGAGITHAQPQKLKVYISVDMEGVVGTVTEDQLSPGGFEYNRYREFMTREALAAVKAAKEAGATEIVVSDGHGNKENLLIEMFPKDVRIIRSAPRRNYMMAGLDQTFDAILCIGYHASTHNLKGVRAHTFSSARITRLSLNGSNVSEAIFNAAIAGHYGVPIVMISGDDAVIEEVQSVLGGIEAAETKKSLGFHAANTLTPEASYELIGQKVRLALGRLKEFKPYVLKKPISLEVSFKSYRPAEVLSYLRNIERIDSHSIRFQAKDMLEAADFMVFATSYSISLEP